MSFDIATQDPTSTHIAPAGSIPMQRSHESQPSAPVTADKIAGEVLGIMALNDRLNKLQKKPIGESPSVHGLVLRYGIAPDEIVRHATAIRRDTEHGMSQSRVDIYAFDPEVVTESDKAPVAIVQMRTVSESRERGNGLFWIETEPSSDGPKINILTLHPRLIKPVTYPEHLYPGLLERIRDPFDQDS
jgi:hypothetical protein